MDDQTPVEQPEETPPRDELLELVLALPDPHAIEAVRALPIDRLALLAARAVNLARAEPDLVQLDRLASLRRVCLLRDARSPLALLLLGSAEVAMALERPHGAVEVLETLVRLRDLLNEPAKAHATALLLAAAQERAGLPAEAEATLHAALGRARALAPGGNLREASACTASTLLQLGTLLAAQGRDDEAEAWLAGAVDVAPDEETANEARSAYATFLDVRGRRADALALLTPAR